MHQPGTKYHSTYAFVFCITLISLGLAQEAQKPLVKHHELIQDIPSIGLGLWNSKDKDATKAVTFGFEAGYHHLDSAAAYDNEKYVGTALTDKSAPSRSSYWITSKLWNTMHSPSNVPTALNQTLADLGVDYLDLYLMHWPVAFKPNEKAGRNIIDQDTSIVDTWRAMQALVSQNRTHPEPGSTRYIGISNFSPRQLDAILTDQQSSIKPYAHEFETHPWLQQQDFVTWHHEHSIRVIAYSPLANLNPTYKDRHPDLPRIIDDDFFRALAERKNATAAQVILAWNLARNVTVIPKSVHESFIHENLNASNVKLTPDEMQSIAEQDRQARFNDPSADWGVKLFESLDGIK